MGIAFDATHTGEPCTKMYYKKRIKKEQYVGSHEGFQCGKEKKFLTRVPRGFTNFLYGPRQSTNAKAIFYEAKGVRVNRLYCCECARVTRSSCRRATFIKLFRIIIELGGKTINHQLPTAGFITTP
jgi:hypothetical protein